VPTFCRHNRLAENCSICAKKARVDMSATGARPAAPRRERAAAPATERPRKPRRIKDTSVSIRKLERAAGDGYGNELVPGLRASADARRLAAAIAAGERWLAGLPTGPVTDADAALSGLVAELGGPADAFAAWAERHDGALAGLTSSVAGSPEARFDRAFERLSIPGFGRRLRIEFLIRAKALGILPEIEPWTLRLADASATDPVLLAAKRIFAIGDPLLISRRLKLLLGELASSVACADHALALWQEPGDIAVVDADLGRVAEIEAALAASLTPPD